MRLEAEAVVAALCAESSLAVVVLLPEGSAGIGICAERTVPLPPVRSGAEAIRADQWEVPRIAKRERADVILSLHVGVPLVSSAPGVAFTDEVSAGTSRVSRSIERASLRGAAVVLSADDLPEAEALPSRVRVPAMIPDVFLHPEASDAVLRPEMQEGYVLCLEEGGDSLPPLLAGWSWVRGSVAGMTSLVLAGGSDRTRRTMEFARREFGAEDDVRVLPFTPDDLPRLMGGASVLLHGGERSNAAALRFAMAAGVPIAGVKTEVSEGVVGSAAFLAPGSDTRSLGAACLTLLVDEPVAEDLRQRGRARVRRHRPGEAVGEWVEAIRKPVVRGRWSVAR